MSTNIYIHPHSLNTCDVPHQKGHPPSSNHPTQTQPERAIRVWPMALLTSFTARDTSAPWFLIFCASSMTMPAVVGLDQKGWMKRNGCKRPLRPRNLTYRYILNMMIWNMYIVSNMGCLLCIYVKLRRGKARDAVLLWNDEVSIGKFLLCDIFVGIPTNPNHYPPQN